VESHKFSPGSTQSYSRAARHISSQKRVDTDYGRVPTEPQGTTNKGASAVYRQYPTEGLRIASFAAQFDTPPLRPRYRLYHDES